MQAKGCICPANIIGPCNNEGIGTCIAATKKGGQAACSLLGILDNLRMHIVTAHCLPFVVGIFVLLSGYWFEPAHCPCRDGYVGEPTI